MKHLIRNTVNNSFENGDHDEIESNLISDEVDELEPDSILAIHRE